MLLNHRCNEFLSVFNFHVVYHYNWLVTNQLFLSGSFASIKIKTCYNLIFRFVIFPPQVQQIISWKPSLRVVCTWSFWTYAFHYGALLLIFSYIHFCIIRYLILPYRKPKCNVYTFTKFKSVHLMLNVNAV